MKKLPDYSVGLEGGVEENLKKMENKNLNMENENLKLEIGLSCFAQLCIFHVPTQKWGEVFCFLFFYDFLRFF